MQHSTIQKLAKLIICLIVIAMSASGMNEVALMSIPVWFYGEDILTTGLSKIFRPKPRTMASRV
jgi:hypothetical protein